ncbi:MAG: PAS domain S-box protein [Chloroflexi bacterium]|nr:PAS domain S-box protein [Chloroflexota bacterium]
MDIPYQTLFQAITEQSGEGICLAATNGDYILVNPAFCQMTGYSEAELLTMNVRDLVLPETEFTLFPRVVGQQAGQQEIELLCQDGSRFLAEIRGYPIQLKDQKLVLGFVRDVTERKKWIADYTTILRDESGQITHYLGYVFDVTERKEAEDRFAQLARFNENIIASAPVGIVTVNRAGKVTSANDAFLKMMDSPGIEETLNLDMSIPTMQSDITAAFNKVLTNGETFSITKLPYTSHWGKELIINLKVVPQKTEEGHISGMIVVVDDVTANVQAERLQTAVYHIAQAADHAASLDKLYPTIHKIIQTVMPADNFYFGLYDETADLLHFPYFVDEKEAAPQPRRPRKGWTEYVLHSSVSQLVDAGRHQTMAAQGEAEPIGALPGVWLGVPLIVENQTIGVMTVQHYDDPHAYGEREQQMLEYVASQVAQTIDRKQKEEALRDSEEKMQSLARLAQKLEQARNHSEIVTPLQKEIQSVLGYQAVWIYLVDENEEYAQLLTGVGEIVEELRDQIQIFKIKGDTYLEYIITVSHPVVVEDARTDPRTNKEIVAQLGNRTIINVPVLLENKRLGILATGTFGDEGVKVPTPAELDYLEAVSRHVAVVIDRIQFLNERERTAQTLQESNQRLQAALAELKDTQERMVQRERLAAVGQLAAGIAHDFNNIMTVIVLYTETGLRLPHLSPVVRERLETISHQAWRATELVQQILDFSRRAVLEPRPLGLIPFLEEQVKLLSRTLPESVQIGFTYGMAEYTVNADPTRLQQAVVNLVVNARDAMPDGGKLRLILARTVTADEVYCAVCQQPFAGEWVRLQVRDNGDGIAPAALSHIFEPFFTTKQVGKGSGLGLSQVAGIVDQHGGHTTVESHIGQGTTFAIYLPILPVRLQPKRSETKPSLFLGKGEMILVVEDDPLMRKALADTVTELNYRVLTAVNGLEALTVLEQRQQEIALVLSDLIMPEMGGEALFQALRQCGLSLPMLILSGHPLEGDLQKLQAQGLAGWLLKPPTIEKLAQLLAQALQPKDE